MPRRARDIRNRADLWNDSTARWVMRATTITEIAAFKSQSDHRKYDEVLQH